VLALVQRNTPKKKSNAKVTSAEITRDGNVHGALEAMLLINEHLEAELHQLDATLSSIFRNGTHLKWLH
jgi:hypothetical protein